MRGLSLSDEKFAGERMCNLARRVKAAIEPGPGCGTATRGLGLFFLQDCALRGYWKANIKYGPQDSEAQPHNDAADIRRDG
jgi:hypothetical protein